MTSGDDNVEPQTRLIRLAVWPNGLSVGLLRERSEVRTPRSAIRTLRCACDVSDVKQNNM